MREFWIEDGRRVVRALVPGWPDQAPDEPNETMLFGAVVLWGSRV